MIDFIRMEKNPAHEGIHGYGVAYVATRKTPISPAELRNFASALMAAVSSACFARGVKDIGHIKAYIEHENGFLLADTLGSPEDLTVKGKDGEAASSFRLVVNSVVFGLAPEAVREATEEALTKVFKEHRLRREPNNRNYKSTIER
jgi:hypothetical protein